MKFRLIIVQSNCMLYLFFPSICSWEDRWVSNVTPKSAKIRFESDDSDSIRKWRADSKFSNRPHLPSYHRLLSLFNKNFNCCTVVIEIYFMFMILSQTWLPYVWLMLWKIRPSVVCDVRAPYSEGLTFRYFAAYPAAYPPKITKIVQGDHPSEQISLTGMWLWDKEKTKSLPSSI